MKNWYYSKNIFQYCLFFVCDFLYQTAPIPPDQNVLILSDQNDLVLLVNNIYIIGISGNFDTENYA